MLPLAFSSGLILLFAYVGFGADPSWHVQKLSWTNVSFGQQGQQAFRDILMEKTIQRFFESFIAKVKDPKLDGTQVLTDPQKVKDELNIDEKGTGYDIKLKARDILAYGLGDLSINYLRVARHFGLKDLQLNITLSTGLRLDGRYTLKGTALSLIPVSGDGLFIIDITNLKLKAHSYLLFDEEKGQLSMRELKLEVLYDDIDFDFQNLMGGGVVGNTINALINIMGEKIIATNRILLIDSVTREFHKIIAKYL